MQWVTLCFTGNLSTSTQEEPGKETGLHQDGAWQLWDHWCLLIQKHYEIAALLEKHKGKHHCQICSISSSHGRSWQYVCCLLYVCCVADSMSQLSFRCLPAGHAANCASRPGDFLTMGLWHLPHTCCMAGTWTELLILLFDFCIPLSKCHLCYLCLASPQNFRGKEPLYLNFEVQYFSWLYFFLLLNLCIIIWQIGPILFQQAIWTHARSCF